MFYNHSNLMSFLAEENKHYFINDPTGTSRFSAKRSGEKIEFFYGVGKRIATLTPEDIESHLQIDAFAIETVFVRNLMRQNGYRGYYLTKTN